MTPELTPALQDALDQEHGGPIHIDGAKDSYVLMTMEVYREIMGVGTDEEFQASVDAIGRGYEAMKQGKTRPMREFLDELGEKHET